MLLPFTVECDRRVTFVFFQFLNSELKLQFLFS